VIISNCGGVQHAHIIASALAERGELCAFITTLNRTDGIPPDLTHKQSAIELPYRLGTRVGGVWKLRGNLLKKAIYDRWQVHFITETCGVFHTYSNIAPRGIERAHAIGATVIIDYSIAHPATIRKLLVEETEHRGLDRVHQLRQHMDTLVVEELVRQADLITVPSEFVKDDLIVHGIEAGKIRMVPYGALDLSLFRPLPRQDERFRLLYVGAINLRKGVPYLLEAFTKLNLSAAELVLCGHLWDNMRSIWEQYRHHPNIRHAGVIPYDQLPRYYSNASVFVFPSLVEGSAHVTYEAMACGLPQIVTPNVGSVVRDGRDGFVVPIRDVDALQEKILYLYEHPDERAAMGRSAHAYAQQFSRQAFARRMLALYDDVLRQESAGDG
jgi:glycosyltransferase involved in cell wall biosynthesis